MTAPLGPESSYGRFAEDIQRLLDEPSENELARVSRGMLRYLNSSSERQQILQQMDEGLRGRVQLAAKKLGRGRLAQALSTLGSSTATEQLRICSADGLEVQVPRAKAVEQSKTLQKLMEDAQGPIELSLDRESMLLFTRYLLSQTERDLPFTLDPAEFERALTIASYFDSRQMLEACIDRLVEYVHRAAVNDQLIPTLLSKRTVRLALEEYLGDSSLSGSSEDALRRLSLEHCLAGNRWEVSQREKEIETILKMSLQEGGEAIWACFSTPHLDDFLRPIAYRVLMEQMRSHELPPAVLPLLEQATAFFGTSESRFCDLMLGDYLPELRFLRLPKFWKGQTNRWPERLTYHCPKVESIKIASDANAELFKALSEQRLDLKELRFGSSRYLKARHLTSFLKNNPRLRTLVLAGVRFHDAQLRFTDRAASRLVKQAPHLKALSLADQVEMTHRGVARIARGLPNLEALNLNGCWLVGDESLLEIAEHCHGLKRLKIAQTYRPDGAPQITEESVLALIRANPGLEELNLQGLPTSEATLDALRLGCPNLRALTLERNNNLDPQAVCELLLSLPGRTRLYMHVDRACPWTEVLAKFIDENPTVASYEHPLSIEDKEP